MRPDVSASGTAMAIEGPLLFLRRAVNASLYEAVEVFDTENRSRLGRIAALDDETLVVEVLETTAGLRLGDVRVRFLGEPMHATVGPDILGRVFNGVGQPIDGGPPIAAAARLRIDGARISPARRALPKDFIETGISAIDLMNSLVRGQKLPIFSVAGLPHDRIAIEIAQNARLRHAERERFAVVFIGIGVSHDSAEAFRRSMEETGALAHTAMFLNLASDPSTQRLLTPRFGLTAAEYLAYHEDRHVLVIMTDMTAYCEALREVSASHGEIPSRKGYPGYMYSDLASLYERAGCIQGVGGTITQVPILTMPSEDITHPIPDLTGYITEGQIVLDPALDRKGVYPPINVLPSLSRLINQGIGKGFTDEEHPALANQLFASYAKANRVRLLASVVGRDGLTDVDRVYLDFAEQFERQLVNQPGRRSLEDSLAIGWNILQQLPRVELARVSDAQIVRHGLGNLAHG